MNRKFFVVLSLLCLNAAIFAQSITEKWNSEIEKQHLLNRQDSLVWDYDILSSEIESKKENNYEMRPFRYGIFPVPKYDLLGENSFTGLGFAGGYREIENTGKNLAFVNFFVYKNKLIEEYLPTDKNSEVFFTIVVLSDVIDTVEYSHTGNSVISRNHPDYIGQGFIKTNNDEINYAAFLTADRNEYAIVNMRLFNLKNGRIILIAPQKDGSLRSMQLKSEQVLSAGDIEKYIDKVLKQETVKKFFTNESNI